MDKKIMALNVSKLNKLVKEAKAFDRKNDRYVMHMMYNGKSIAKYDMSDGDRSIDRKSVEDWVRGNMVFLVELNGLDSENVYLKYEAAQ